MSQRDTDPTGRYTDLFAGAKPPDLKHSNVVAVVICYNESLRLPHFFEHHKRLGIDKFFVVDNASTDGSGELLAADPDVVHLHAPQAYAEFKSIWREVIADACLVGKWTLFIDVDELLVYPTWPHETLPDYCRRLNDRDFDALHATMVDMYPARPLTECRYNPGQNMLDVADWFDTGNYRLIPTKPSDFHCWSTPNF